MEIKILHLTPLWLCANAIRYSHNSHKKADSAMIIETQNINTMPTCTKCGNYIAMNKLKCDKCNIQYDKNTHIGKKDLELIHRIGNKHKHKSVLEFIQIQIELKGISRALLQEQARHRIASLCMKSTRYTLKELQNEKIKWLEVNGSVTDEAYEMVNKYCVLPKIKNSTKSIMFRVQIAKTLGSIAALKLNNDQAKYMLPECYKTEGQLSINMRSLQNYYQLRSSKEALWEIRELANEIARLLPDGYREILVRNNIA